MSRIEELIREKCPDGVEFRKISEICIISRGKVMSKDYIRENAGDYPVYSSQTENNGELGRIATYEYEGEYLTWTTDGANAGTVFHREGQFSVTNVCGLLKIQQSDVICKYLFYALSFEAPEHVNQGMGNAKLMSNVMADIEIPIPPIQVQQEIVRILDKFTELEAELQSELAARKKQYEYYRMKLLTFDEDMSTVMFPEISDNFDRKRKPITGNQREQGDIPYYGASGVIDYVKDYLFEGDYLLISEDGANLTARVSPIAFSISGRTWVNNHAHILQFRTDIERKFVEYYLNSIDLSYYITGAAQPKLNQDNLNKIPIPNPSFVEKKKIVEILDVFSELCEDEETGLPAEIAARHKQYEYYRDKLLTFKRKEV